MQPAPPVNIMLLVNYILGLGCQISYTVAMTVLKMLLEDVNSFMNNGKSNQMCNRKVHEALFEFGATHKEQ